MDERLWEQFLPYIKQLPADRPLNKEDLLTDDLLMKQEDELRMYYAPHNDYINTHARVVIVGITPGWQQMKQAFEAVLGMKNGCSSAEMLRTAKQTARFAGRMRLNLIRMLDDCALAETLGLSSSEALFDPGVNWLHTTSVIKYPVFYQGRNYNGHNPKMFQSDLLFYYATEIFPVELNDIKEDALVIPLGKMVESVFQTLQSDHKLPNHTYLYNMPHPSGGNGHRKKQFLNNQEQLEKVIRKWGMK